MKNFIFGLISGIYLSILAIGMWNHFDGELYGLLIFGIFIPIFYAIVSTDIY